MSEPYIGPIQTEAHWLTSGDASAMEEFLGERGSLRRWQLFACHCCWRILPLLTDERSRQSVCVAERLAEGLASRDEVRAAQEDANLAMLQAWRSGLPVALAYAATAAAYVLTSPRRVFASVALATGSNHQEESLGQCRLLRDLFGNPFRPFLVDPAWRTPTVRMIADQIYHRESFDEMTVLGDALEDAGCNEESLLAHLHDRVMHHRGCWALDAVLDKP